MPTDEVTKLVPADAEPWQREKRDAWLEQVSKEELVQYARMNSCLCDASGICAACKHTDAEAHLEWAVRLLDEVKTWNPSSTVYVVLRTEGDHSGTETYAQCVFERRADAEAYASQRRLEALYVFEEVAEVRLKRAVGRGFMQRVEGILSEIKKR